MNFIDEQYIVAVKIGKYRRQVAGTLYCRSGGNPEIDSDFGSDNVGKGRLAQTRWSV